MMYRYYKRGAIVPYIHGVRLQRVDFDHEECPSASLSLTESQPTFNDCRVLWRDGGAIDQYIHGVHVYAHRVYLQEGETD